MTLILVMNAGVTAVLIIATRDLSSGMAKRQNEIAGMRKVIVALDKDIKSIKNTRGIVTTGISIVDEDKGNKEHSKDAKVSFGITPDGQGIIETLDENGDILWVSPTKKK